MKYFNYNVLAIAALFFTLFVASCGSAPEKSETIEEDDAAKKMMQGSWVNEIDGNLVFSAKGDTLYYNDSLTSPMAFRVFADTLYLSGHSNIKYRIHKLNSSTLSFENADGDIVELTKSNTSMPVGVYKGAVVLNQGKRVKSDTVFSFREKRYHAYMQVNPTTYKVYRQTTNADGLTVENVYYDNIVYVALYDGQRKLFGQNIVKSEFNSLVPPNYLSQAVLSEIVLDGVKGDNVRFVAVLSIPDSYASYRVNIDVDQQGHKNLSL